ncbi:site-specific integrase [Microbulbifer rhizosphaerae]|nr:site-specific integrase [Microbulbifer rhizosphaerae]
MDRLRAFMRARHMAYRTEKSYCGWIREFIRFHDKRHPEMMGAAEVEAWLSLLTNNRSVAINTQKTALNAPVSPAWQYVFPAPNRALDPRSQVVRRSVARALAEARIYKKASCYTLGTRNSSSACGSRPHHQSCWASLRLASGAGAPRSRAYLLDQCT